MIMGPSFDENTCPEAEFCLKTFLAVEAWYRRQYLDQSDKNIRGGRGSVRATELRPPWFKNEIK